MKRMFFNERQKKEMDRIYKFFKSDNRIWTKLPDNMIAEYDKKLMTSGGWHGQKICTFDDNNNHNRKVWVES